MKVCSRLLMALVEISAKKDKFGYLNPILGKLEVTRGLGWWLAGKPMVDFLFALIELFSLSIAVPELWAEMCTARLFSQGVDLFALKFYLDKVISSNRSWYQKTRYTGLHYGEDGILLCSPFWHNTGVWRTNGRTDLPKHIARLQN